MSRVAHGRPERRRAAGIAVGAAVVFGLIALAGGAARAEGAAPAGIETGMPYAAAREKLVAGGWTPEAFPETTAEERCGSGRIDVCEAFPETESCSGTGLGFCLFAFRDAKGRKAAVTTAGEEIEDFIVHGWRYGD